MIMLTGTVGANNFWPLSKYIEIGLIPIHRGLGMGNTLWEIRIGRDWRLQCPVRAVIGQKGP